MALSAAADTTADDKTALCLSGGGYRAVAFHTGVLWRLNELGVFQHIVRVSAVSGGALLAGCLAMAWPKLDGSAETFKRLVAGPMRNLLDVTIGTPAYVRGLLPGHTANGELARYFQDYLYGDAMLETMPSRPDFVFCATDLRHGTLWTFDRRQMGNTETGWYDASTVPLATAIAASAAFPLILAPARIDLRRYPPHGGQLQMQPKNAVLTDGGVYDVLALDPVCDEKFAALLVSDADEALPVQPRPAWNWLGQITRVREIAMSQVRVQRLARARAACAKVFSLTADSQQVALLGFDAGVIPKLLTLPTLFVRMDRRTQEDLINWGYIVCAAALGTPTHRHSPAPSLPYPR